LPSGALTRFLKQGLTLGMCPVCRVAQKVDAEYIWYFFDEYSGDASTLDGLRRARGFCAEHADGLRQLEVDGFKSTLGISTTYLDTVDGLLGELEALRTTDAFTSEPCPACAYRSHEVESNARYLLEELDENERSRQRFADGPGLCMRHFEHVWSLAEPAQRQLLLEVERRNVAKLAADLREDIRKQGAEARGESAGAEAGSWRRALQLTAGWSSSNGDGDDSGGGRGE
jgi:hypothetical protein